MDSLRYMFNFNIRDTRPMIKHIKIYDIDGVLVDSSHRYKTNIKNGRNYIDLPHWRAHDNEKYIMRDSLLPLARQYKADLTCLYTYTILATARACIADDANYRFIQEHLGKPDLFIHRKGPDDMRGGAVIKINGIKPLLNLKPFQDAAITFYEDNLNYLSDVCAAIGARPVFIPSIQGY